MEQRPPHSGSLHRTPHPTNPLSRRQYSDVRFLWVLNRRISNTLSFKTDNLLSCWDQRNKIPTNFLWIPWLCYQALLGFAYCRCKTVTGSRLQILLRPASRDSALLRSAWEPLGTTKYGSCTVLHLAGTISSTRKRAVKLEGKVVIVEPCSGSCAAVETQALNGPMGVLSSDRDSLWFVSVIVLMGHCALWEGSFWQLNHCLCSIFIPTKGKKVQLAKLISQRLYPVPANLTLKYLPSYNRKKHLLTI